MDPTIETIIMGIITNVFTGFFASIARRGGKIIVGKELIAKIERDKTSLKPILQRAAIAVSEDIEWDGPARMEEVCLFLTSPEVESIVRQIYSAKLSLGKDENSLELIRKEFLTSFGLYIGLPESKINKAAKSLLEALINGCEHAIDIAIEDGILSAHEAKSAFRYRIIRDELASIRKIIDFISLQNKPRLNDYLEFENKYRNQVAARHGFIIPPHFDVAQKLSIEKLYVSPNFSKTSKKKNEITDTIDTSGFLSGIHRAVLLGNPGGGKSTFASKLCYDLSKRYNKRIFAGRKVTPIFVILRDYGAEKKSKKLSVIQFVEMTANSTYQVKAPPDAFEYLLLSGRAVVIFDGLDELLDTSYRQEVSNDIESFCNLFPSVPVLVTSRVVGYEQAPLDREIFDTYYLAPFDEDQVQEYVTKWFATDTELTPEQQKQKANTFYEESQIVPDLRSNPLMLALMCNIYRGENYIPRNRPDVYEKCATMLFERWDKSRGIHVVLPFEAHISPAIKYLAYWIYSDEKRQGGVTERNLVAKTKEYLCPRRFEDPEDAEKAACEFIEFCQGRAWVFTDLGTTKEGEKLFQFTHRTFLEYFAAAHLIRIYPTPNKLKEIIFKKIAKREWDVVAQLACQLQNKNVEGAGDKLLIELLERAEVSKGIEKWNFLSFLARCLEFMIPSPKVIREITTACLSYCQRYGKKRIGRDALRIRSYREYTSELITDLFNTAVENRNTIIEEIKNTLTEKINKSNEEESISYAQLTALLFTGLVSRAHRPALENTKLAKEMAADIFDVCSSRLDKLIRKNFELCYCALIHQRVSLGNLIKWHGVENIFGPTLRVYFGMGLFQIAELLILSLRGEIYYALAIEKEITIQYLKEIGNILFSSPLPWIKKKQEASLLNFMFTDSLYYRHRAMKVALKKQPKLDSDSLFGYFVLFATLLEVNQKARHFSKIKKGILLDKSHSFKSIHRVLLARYDKEVRDTASIELDKLRFTKKKKEFIFRWTKKEINFVKI